jgi:hypothetical protein
MQKLLKNSPITFAIVLGFVLLIPFVALEVVNRWKFNESFPFALFTFAWVLQTAFVYIGLPIVKTIRSGKSVTNNPLQLAIRVAGMLLIAYIWGGWVVDQWPCLMGVPNCD